MFYGKVQGGRGATSRCGHSSITASVQSYDGSIITELTHEGDKLMVRVSTSTEDTFHGSTIFYGPFEEYIAKLKN